MRPLLGKHPYNYGKHPLPDKRPGNVSQDDTSTSNDEADEKTYEDHGDVDDIDPFSDSDELNFTQ